MKYFLSATKLTLLTLVFALVYMSIVGIEVNETFSNIINLVIAFYFGQKTNQIVSDAKTLTVENKDTTNQG